MGKLNEMIDLVNSINQKFDKSKYNASIHITRHEIKLKVYGGNFDAIINERVRYFNDAMSFQKMESICVELKYLLSGDL